MTDRDSETLYVTDAELIRRLNLPKRLGYRAIRRLEEAPGNPKFPEKDPVFKRRFLPAVEKYLMLRHGMTDNADFAATHLQESNNATTETGTTGGNTDARASVEAQKASLERLLGRTAGRRRRRLSYKKPSLVGSGDGSDA